MHNVTIIDQNNVVSIPAKAGETLLAVLQRSEVHISFPCGGNHTCGKCLVEADGNLSPITDREEALLRGAPAGTRLACFSKIEGSCTVRLLSAGKNRIESNFEANDSAVDSLYQEGYGAAFDIGTTTVVGYLFSKSSKNPLAVCGRMNDQRIYGADVLSRIDFCNRNTVAEPNSMIRRQLTSMLNELCSISGISPREIRAMTVCGNTTMLHILCGFEPRSLGVAPFEPVSYFGDWFDLKLDGFADVKSYLPRCVSAYVGADITCSTLTSGIMDNPLCQLLIDIGTNGEMVLKTQDMVVSCSTAAGPAFEGAGISYGSSAVSGAINRVFLKDNKIIYTTIDEQPAVSLCGSGLIDAAAAFLEAGFILPSGRLKSVHGNAVRIGDSDVMLTQSDIRQLQLAKAAIAAGIDTLLHECGTTYDSIDRVILCGGFGSYIDPHSAAKIGLLPYEFVEKTTAIGNAAGTGAGRILQSRRHKLEAEGIASKIRTIELSTSTYFAKRYIKAMSF